MGRGTRHNLPMIKLSRAIFLIIASLALVATAILYFACRDHSGYFLRKKGTLASAVLSPYASDSTSTRHRLVLRSDSGLQVECGLLLPEQGRSVGRHPAVVLLAGLETGRRAIDYISDIPGVVIAAADYPYTPGDLDSAKKVLAEMPPLRRAALDTVPSAILLVDYLSRRPDVDPARIIVVGLSMGAIFVPCLAAEDRRFAAAVMVFGGGDLRAVIKHDIRGFTGKYAADLLSSLGGLLLCPIEPMRYADRISPMPLLMINGTRDQMIPRRCTEMFFQKAKGPKKLIWLPVPHMTPGNLQLTTQIVRTLQDELTAMKLLTAPESR